MEVRFALLVLAIAGSLMASGLTSRFGLIARVVQLGLAAAVVPLIWTYHRKIYIIIRTLPRDVKFLYRYVNADRETRQFVKNNSTVVKLFRERARLYPNKPCFIFEDRTWTNADVDKYSNRIAAVFKNAGYVKGDAVALLMPNKPEYVATWLGLGKLGVITALINTNLRMQSLVHCLTIAKVKAIIYSDELAFAIDDVVDSLPGIQRYRQGSDEAFTDGVINLNEVMSKASDQQPVIDEEPGYKDNLLYIYTSGTTGLPKAALFPNSRYLLVQTATHHMLGLRPKSDIVYNPIPLYHMSGGIVGTGCALVKGIPSVLRTKFSVTAYWTDCIKYNCTISQYIGEMCRYLLSAPPRPDDSTHPVRLMVGNGMRPQIWQNFVNRFKIEQVNEVYGSSEGNANIVNVDNTVGAVGFVPSILPKSLHPVAIIRINPETCEPIRSTESGFCIRAEPNEPGMLIGLIKQGNASREFNGYLDKEASKKKTIEDVFIKGDKAFLTGDILVQDEYGYFYFKDRTGDTFRWKGENVATAEVEGVVSNVAGYRDTTVYGVQVPGMEGRAGMAAIVDPDSLLDFKALAEGLDQSLPSYARPIFLRIVKELELTSTFKLKKINLQKEGFDPNKIQDKVYFRSGNKEYVEVTPELYEEIISGMAKL